MATSRKAIRVKHFDRLYSIPYIKLRQWFTFQWNTKQETLNPDDTFCYELNKTFKMLKELPSEDELTPNWDVDFLDMTIQDAYDKVYKFQFK